MSICPDLSLIHISQGDKLLVQGVDLLDNRRILMETDMVVLATAIEPNPDVRKIATNESLRMCSIIHFHFPFSVTGYLIR